MVKINYCFFLLLLIIGCQNKQDSSLGIFRPSFNVKSSELLKEGFVKVRGADIPMYSKINGDTTIVYTYDFNEKKTLTKHWYIQLPNTNLKTVKRFFEKQLLSTQILHQLFEKSADDNQKNYIYNYDYNQIYEIKLDVKANKIVFIYYYDYNYKIDDSL